MNSRPAVSRVHLALLLGGLAMFGPFAIDTIFPAFRIIGGEFSASPAAMQQTISVYLIAYALASLFHGPLSDAVGRRPVILWGVVIFALASVASALAQDLPQLLLFRALQGASAGTGMIVGRAVIRDCLDGDDAQRMMSQVTMIFGIAPAVAPVVGGWILGWSDWRMIFWFLTAFSLLLFALTAAWLPETHPRQERVPMNLRALFHGSRAILANRQFLLLSLASSFNFGALFLYIASAPAFVLDLMRLDEQQFGWFFIPMISGMMFGAFLSGKVAGRLTGAQCVGFGFGLCAASMLLNLGYNLVFDAPQAPWAVLPMALNAVGIAMVFPILTLAILDLYPRQRGSASSMQAFVGLSFNAVLSGLVSPWASHSAMRMALVATMFFVFAWLLWRLYRREVKREPGCGTGSVSLEPSEQV